MSTQRQAALKGEITPQMIEVARAEGLSAEEVRSGLAQGIIAVPYNPLHKNCQATGIGRGLKQKTRSSENWTRFITADGGVASLSLMIILSLIKRN